MSQMIGQMLGGYKILGELGRGSMGVVFKAQQLSMDREVALKLLPQNLAKDEKRVLRFLREAQTAGQLSHPHIVAIYDVGVAAGQHYIAMELVHGPTLYKRCLEKGPCSEKETLRFALQAAQALKCAHARGILHRDIKPDNFLLDPSNNIRVADFGMALITNGENQDAHLTQDGIALGTPYYMPPEQCKGSHNADQRSDLYSLGASLYFIATGKTPFTGATPPVIMAKVLSEPPAPLNKVRPDLSPAFVALIEKLMAKNPGKRYADAEQAIEAIEQCLSGRPVAAKSPVKTAVRAVSELNRPRAEKSPSFLVYVIPAIVALTVIAFVAQPKPEVRLAAKHSPEVKPPPIPTVVEPPPVAQPSTPPPVAQASSLPPVAQPFTPPPVAQPSTPPPVAQASSPPPVAQASSLPPVAQASSLPPVAQASSLPPVAQASSLPPVAQASSLPPVVQPPSLSTESDKIKLAELQAAASELAGNTGQAGNRYQFKEAANKYQEGLGALASEEARSKALSCRDTYAAAAQVLAAMRDKVNAHQAQQAVPLGDPKNGPVLAWTWNDAGLTIKTDQLDVPIPWSSVTPDQLLKLASSLDLVDTKQAQGYFTLGAFAFALGLDAVAKENLDMAAKMDHSLADKAAGPLSLLRQPAVAAAAAKPQPPVQPEEKKKEAVEKPADNKAAAALKEMGWTTTEGEWRLDPKAPGVFILKDGGKLEYADADAAVQFRFTLGEGAALEAYARYIPPSEDDNDKPARRPGRRGGNQPSLPREPGYGVKTQNDKILFFGDRQVASLNTIVLHGQTIELQCPPIKLKEMSFKPGPHRLLLSAFGNKAETALDGLVGWRSTAKLTTDGTLAIIIKGAAIFDSLQLKKKP